jgi:hypothetical protein
VVQVVEITAQVVVPVDSAPELDLALLLELLTPLPLVLVELDQLLSETKAGMVITPYLALSHQLAVAAVAPAQTLTVETAVLVAVRGTPVRLAMEILHLLRQAKVITAGQAQTQVELGKVAVVVAQAR